MTSETTNGGTSEQRRLANLKPFKPGQSGNPSGLPKARANRASMITDQRAKLEAHHGRPVSVVEAELIECMVDIKLTVPNTAAERLKRANALGRFMLALYGHGKPIERHRSMEEQLAMIDQDEPAA